MTGPCVTTGQEDDGRWWADADTAVVSASVYGDTEVLALIKLAELLCEEIASLNSVLNERDF